MPIKNYTTEVSVDKTCGEIYGILTAKGVRRLQIDYDNSIPTAIEFVYPVHNFPVLFRLPANVNGVLACLKAQKGVEWRYRTLEHARKVAWRIVKNWLEAQIALVEAGAAQMSQVFMPYAVQQDGKTMFELFDETYAAKALMAGEPQKSEAGS